MKNLYIGMLSGTSMDGIDVAIVDCQQHQILAADTYPYPDSLHRRIAAMAAGEAVCAAEFARLNRETGLVFAQACQQLLNTAKLPAQAVRAIGSHGQTIAHNPDAIPASTLQLGCPHTIACETKIETVADFRGADMAHGGQGAPLAPLYHRELFQAMDKPLAIVNIGGVANLSWLKEDGQYYGLDTGPGNALMDAWINRCCQKSHDDQGKWAASGTLLPELLAAMMADPYFSQTVPKSLDKFYFDLNWLEQFRPALYRAVDIQTTLAHLTAKSIALIVTNGQRRAKQLIVCGGGAHNQFLLQCLSRYCPDMAIKRTQEFNLNDNYIEAMLFAWLAQQRILGHKLDAHACTGAVAPHYFGIIYPP